MSPVHMVFLHQAAASLWLQAAKSPAEACAFWADVFQAYADCLRSERVCELYEEDARYPNVLHLRLTRSAS